MSRTFWKPCVGEFGQTAVRISPRRLFWTCTFSEMRCGQITKAIDFSGSRERVLLTHSRTSFRSLFVTLPNLVKSAQTQTPPPSRNFSSFLKVPMNWQGTCEANRGEVGIKSRSELPWEVDYHSKIGKKTLGRFNAWTTRILHMESFELQSHCNLVYVEAMDQRASGKHIKLWHILAHKMPRKNL